MRVSEGKADKVDKVDKANKTNKVETRAYWFLHLYIVQPCQ